MPIFASNYNHQPITMNEKFPYCYDVNVFIDKSFERIKEFYPSANKSGFTL